jgi:hypothetical protein
LNTPSWPASIQIDWNGDGLAIGLDQLAGVVKSCFNTNCRVLGQRFLFWVPQSAEDEVSTPADIVTSFGRDLALNLEKP